MTTVTASNLQVKTDLSNEVNEIVDTMAIYMDKVNSLSTFISELKIKTTKIENEFNKMLSEINEFEIEIVSIVDRLSNLGNFVDVDNLYATHIEPKINDMWTDYEDGLGNFVDVLDVHFSGYDSINKKLAYATSLKNNPSLKSSMSTLNFTHSSAASISENIDLDMEDFLSEVYLTECTTILNSTITFLESKANLAKKLIKEIPLTVDFIGIRVDLGVSSVTADNTEFPSFFEILLAELEGGNA